MENMDEEVLSSDNKKTVVKNKPVYRFFKRLFDIIISLFLLILLSIPLVIVAFIIKISDRGPALYRSPRVGLNGKIIDVFKFRSMKVGSDKLENFFTKEELEKFKNEFKIEDDKRITKIGRFIRKTSIDELPQLFNVLGGSMSLVGPRPISEEEIKKYGDDASLLVSAKPGMTGLWQCSGRNKLTYADGKRQQTELYYVKNCSLWFDVKIIFKTVFAVFRFGDVLN